MKDHVFRGTLGNHVSHTEFMFKIHANDEQCVCPLASQAELFPPWFDLSRHHYKSICWLFLSHLFCSKSLTHIPGWISWLHTTNETNPQVHCAIGSTIHSHSHVWKWGVPALNNHFFDWEAIFRQACRRCRVPIRVTGGAILTLRHPAISQSGASIFLGVAQLHCRSRGKENSGFAYPEDRRELSSYGYEKNTMRKSCPTAW